MPALPCFCRAGLLKSTLQGHRGMIMAVRWNKKGDLLLSGAAGQAAGCTGAVAAVLVHLTCFTRQQQPGVRDSRWRAGIT
jgi:hypothetical protein